MCDYTYPMGSLQREFSATFSAPGAFSGRAMAQGRPKSTARTVKVAV
jgi:hypothetical protein